MTPLRKIVCALIAATVGSHGLIAWADEDNRFSEFGLRLGGVIVGALSWRLEQCGDKAIADEILASLASQSDMTPEKLTAIMEGADLGAKRAAAAAAEKGETFTEAECAEWKESLSSATRTLSGQESTSAPLVASPDVERSTHVQCAELEADQERLACHDRVAAAERTLQDGETAYGAWTVRVRDGYDGKTVILTQLGDGHLIGLHSTRPVTAHIRCKENTTELYLSFGENFGAIKKAAVYLDGQMLGNLEMSSSLLGGAAFWPSREEPLIPFLKQIVAGEAQQLSIRTTVIPEEETMGTPPVSEISFSLNGLRDGLEPIAQACLWR